MAPKESASKQTYEHLSIWAMVTFLCLIRKKSSVLQKVSHYSLKIPSFCCSIVIARTFSCSTKDMMTCVLFPSNSFFYSLNHNVQCDHQKLVSNLQNLTVLGGIINNKNIVHWLHACFLPRWTHIQLLPSPFTRDLR